MSTSDSHATSFGRREADRFLRWLLVLLLVLGLAPIPIYIYVLEQHSNALAKHEARIAVLETALKAAATIDPARRGY